jgi:hypothetical protein
MLRCAVVKQASIRQAGVDGKFRCPPRGVAAIGVTSAYDSLEFQVFFSTELAEGHVIDLLQFAYIWDMQFLGLIRDRLFHAHHGNIQSFGERYYRDVRQPNSLL